MSRKKSYFTNYLGVGQRIKIVRNDLSQYEFGKLIGVTQGTVNKYESGATLPSEGVLQKIADHGGVTTDWLLKGEGGGDQTKYSLRVGERAPETYDARPRFLDKDALAHVIFLMRDWLRRKKEKLSVPAEAELIALLYEYWLTNHSYPDDQVISKHRDLLKE